MNLPTYMHTYIHTCVGWRCEINDDKYDVKNNTIVYSKVDWISNSSRFDVGVAVRLFISPTAF